jgi:hypothetical protein
MYLSMYGIRVNTAQRNALRIQLASEQSIKRRDLKGIGKDMAEKIHITKIKGGEK